MREAPESGTGDRPRAHPESQDNVPLQRWLDGLPVAAYICDSEGRITAFNVHAAALWGRTPALNDPAERFCGSLRLFAPDGTPVAHSDTVAARALTANAPPLSQELVIERPGGERLAVSAYASPWHDEAARLVGTVNVLIDISAHKRQETALHKRNQEFLNLVEGSPDIVARFDRDFKHLYVNRAVEGVAGMPASAFIGKTNAELGMDQALVQGWQAELLEVFTTGQERAAEFTFPSPGGGVHYHVRLVPELSAQGEVESVLGISRNVTELKRVQLEKAELLEREREARREAERANERLAFLVEASTVLNASLDYEETLGSVASLAVPTMADWCAVDFLLADGSLQRVALAHVDSHKLGVVRLVQERYPSKPGTPYGIMKVLETGQPELYPEISDHMLEHVAQDAGELAALRHLGMKSALVVPLVTRAELSGVISLGLSESGRRYGEADLKLAEELARRAAVAIDNAWLYRQSQALNEELEARVASRTERLEQANRELEHFAYAVSHDLRSPLSAIKGFAQALAEDHEDELSSQARFYLTRIHGNAERMAELIDDILLLSKVSRQELRLEPVDLCELAREISRALMADAPQRQVDFRCKGDAQAEADRGLLRIVLENLLDNAWKFTGKRERASVAFSTQEEEEGVLCSLRDNGAGFDPAFADKLFKPFHRLHDTSDYQGTGIGLATVKRVIERHGGRIWAESAVDRGTTFFFTLNKIRNGAGKSAANEERGAGDS